MSKRNYWFNNYENQRDLDYRKINLQKNDFENSSVIDLGCNTGQLCRYSSDIGAKYVLGIDYDKTAIENARLKSKKYSNIDYLCDDADNFMFYTNLDNFDTGLFFSVIGTKELNNRFGILSKLSSKILKTMYIEGHHTVFRKEELLRAILNYTTFTYIEYLGLSYDNKDYKEMNKSRDLFRCERKKYTVNESINKIVELLKHENKLIAIQGHGGTGKTTLRNKLINYLNNNTNYKINDNNITNNKGYFKSTDNSICILDDIANANIKELKQRHKYIVYFDYRVLEYLKNEDIHTLFILNYDIKERFKNRPELGKGSVLYNRSQSINNFINNIYHIKSYSTCINQNYLNPFQLKNDISISNSNKASEITFVTGLWDIGRGNLNNTSNNYDWKRSLDKYKNQLEVFLKTGLKIIVFGDLDLKNWIEKFDNCIFVYYPLENFREKFNFYEQINNIRTSSEWYDQPGASWLKYSPQAKLDMYIPITLTKIRLIKNASKLNPFKSNKFFWVDAGYTRFHNVELLANFQEKLTKYDKFLFLSHKYVTNSEIHGFLRTGMNSFCNKDFISRIMKGFFFGGVVKDIDKILDLYNKIIKDTLELKLLGTEESYFTILINKYPDLFEEVLIKNCHNTMLYL